MLSLSIEVPQSSIQFVISLAQERRGVTTGGSMQGKLLRSRCVDSNSGVMGGGDARSVLTQSCVSLQRGSPVKRRNEVDIKVGL